MKNEIVVGLVIDDYKLKDLDKWWKFAMTTDRFKEEYPSMDKYKLKSTKK